MTSSQGGLLYVHVVSPCGQRVLLSYPFPCSIGEVGTGWQRVNAICRGGGGVLSKVAKGLGKVAGEIIPPWGPP